MVRLGRTAVEGLLAKSAVLASSAGMARVLLIALNLTGTPWNRGAFVSLGVMSSLLRKHGHRCRFLLLRDSWRSRHELRAALGSVRPDLIGFSAMSSDLSHSLELCRQAKRISGAATIFGGVHPTLEPEETIRDASVDFVCVGEGEYPLLELADGLSANRDVSKICNLWCRRDGSIVRNPQRPLNDVAALPAPDLELLYGGRSPVYFASSTTACPYSCAHCCSQALRQRAAGLGTICRTKPVEKLIDELLAAKRELHMSRVSFVDGNFVHGKRWMLEFCERYAESIGLPFAAQASINCMDDEILVALRRAGCYLLGFGIESGVERTRREVLRKEIGTNEEIARMIRAVKAAGIEVGANFLLGIPGEREEEMARTYRFARSLPLDQVYAFNLVPFRHTQIWQTCNEQHLIASDPHFTTRSDVSHLSYSTEHRAAIRKYFNRIYNLSTYKKYRLLRRFRPLRPLYDLVKSVVGHYTMEMTRSRVAFLLGDLKYCLRLKRDVDA